MDAAVLARENALLKARLIEVEAALAESQEANRRLEDILRTSQREKFGKRSEKLSPDQFNLPLEDAELAQGVLEAAQEMGLRDLTICASSLGKSHSRVAQMIEEGTVIGIQTSGIRDRIGEDVSFGRLATPAIIRSHGGRVRRGHRRRRPGRQRS